MLIDEQFSKIVREERLFCNILSHLLWTRGANLRNFLALIDEKLPTPPASKPPDLEQAQVYTEYSLLRDHWKSLGHDNDAKRNHILNLLSTVPLLAGHSPRELPTDIAKFNALFMGEKGRSITKDIAFPGLWSVIGLHERFGGNKKAFREFCKFKWAFNIKPDIVVLLPGNQPISIEAKLESRQGHYPANRAEQNLFNGIYGKKRCRVGQLELQEFMFGNLLQRPCRPVVIGKTPFSTDVPHIFISWEETFARLDLGQSLPFVRNLVENNRYLGQKRAPTTTASSRSPSGPC